MKRKIRNHIYTPWILGHGTNVSSMFPVESRRLYSHAGLLPAFPWDSLG